MNRKAQRAFVNVAAVLGVAIVIVLAFLFASGCGSPSGGKVDQAQYCKDNGWIYEPATDTCRVPR